MEIQLKDKPFGQITSISGNNITIEIYKDNNLINEKLVQEVVIDNASQKFYVGNVGDIFMIGGPSTSDDIHYAIFEEVKLVSLIDIGQIQVNPTTNNNDDKKAIITAKVIGYQTNKVTEKLSFERGVGHYPKYNSKCYLLTVPEKQQMFSIAADLGVNIGKIPGVQKDEEVAINIDKFLSKHSVILGSTGSGKSCTVASIIQKILQNHDFSHMVFFDLHDEYSTAFPANYNDIYKDGKLYKVNKQRAKNFQLPYWLLNYEEFLTIFLGELDQSSNSDGIRILKDEILLLKRESHETLTATGQVNDILKISINSPLHFSFNLLLQRLKNLNRKTRWKDNKPALYSDLDETKLENAVFLDERKPDVDFLPASSKGVYIRRGVSGMQQTFQESSYNKLTSIIEKLETIHADKRYEFLFPDNYDISTSFYNYIINLLSIPQKSNTDKEVTQNQLTILDLSRIPSEISPVIIGVVSRLCFEYKVWEEDPHIIPLYLVFEEAHNYIPSETTPLTRLTQKYISRIAKEGRKYGISQLIVSQRPSDLSQLIVSQCSNFFVLRVTNPNDQSFINQVLPDHLSALSNMIPFFQNGECLIAGECVSIPVKVLIDEPKPFPRSNDVKFSEKWKKMAKEYDVKATIHKWWDIKEEEEDEAN